MSIQGLQFPELRLLQITDSAFPSGSFAFSYGLESMAKLGRIRDVSDFRKFLLNVLAQISFSEIPFLNSSYHCASDEHGPLIAITERLDAYITTPCIRKASVTQGRSLLLGVKAVYPEQNFDQFAQWLLLHELPTHYAPIFGVVARTIGIGHLQALCAYLYIALRDQVSAAIRLGLVGPFEGHGILRQTFEQVGANVSRVKDLEYHQAFKIAAALEIAQAYHPKLYSHLFQN